MVRGRAQCSRPAKPREEVKVWEGLGRGWWKAEAVGEHEGYEASSPGDRGAPRGKHPKK